MEFKKAIDELGVKHAEVATALGVSVASIKQARMDSDAAGHRPPPREWKRALAKLAKGRAAHLLRLADQIERSA